MNSPKADVEYSIVVPAFNEEKLLGATLDRLNQILEAIPEAGEIIVTDNNSTDRTAEIAREHGARVIFESHQQIARSRNTGGKVSNAQYLIFVDADTLVSEALIRASLDALKTGKVSGGGALADFTKGTGHDKGIERVTRIWDFLARKLHWACGAYVFCRKDAFDAVGGFSEKVYASEEIHFSRAVRKWGRTRSMEFVILDQYIETSPRKLEWFGIWGLIKMSLPILFCPFLVRSKRFCDLWYKRPGGKA